MSYEINFQIGVTVCPDEIYKALSEPGGFLSGRRISKQVLKFRSVQQLQQWHQKDAG
jgi:hypothetical protein